MHLIDVQNIFYNDNLDYKSEINYLNRQIGLYKRALSDLENKKVSQIVKDLIYEKYHISNNRNIDILNIALMLISTIIYISIVLTYIIKQYKSEKVLFAK